MEKQIKQIKLDNLKLLSFVTTVQNTKKVEGGNNPWVNETTT